jgi:hypothetical protein
MSNTKNKILTLHTESIRVLEYLAKKDGRSVKNYMERVLIGHANDFEVEYKKSKSTKK